jgi:hypothetical protein
VSRLFGAYIIVDYSAAEGKKTGASSVWIGVVKRDVRFRLTYESFNPATRAEAYGLLKEILADLHKRGDRVFMGFDFALGLPRGTAKALKLETAQPWAAIWRFLQQNIVDKPDNTNNRFAVAAKINRLMTDDAYPFWGCPKSSAQKWLGPLKPASFGEFPELRLTEEAARRVRKTATKSLWQMHGAGVVGGQTLLGIVMVKQLTDSLGGTARVWPFETGFFNLSLETLAGANTVIAEIYPSLYPGEALAGEVKDATQVRLTSHVFAEFDDKGQFSKLFDAPKSLNEDELLIASQQEGWILGV